MRIACMLAVVGVCLSTAGGQTLEKVVYLPDSLCAVPGPQHIVYNRANQTVYVAGRGLGVLAIAGSTGRKETVIETGVYAHAMCCDSVLNKVYVATWNEVVVIDGASNAVRARIPVGCYSPVLFSDAALSKVYCADSEGTDLTVIDAVGDSVTKTVPVGSGAAALCSDPTGSSRIYCALAGEGKVAVLDAKSDTLLGKIGVGSGPCALLCDSLRNRVYCANHGSRSVSVIGVPDDSVVATVTTQRYPRGLAYDPMRSRLYVACEYHEVTVVDCAADTVCAHVAVDNAPWDLVFDGASDRAYCADHADQIAVIDAETDTIVKTLQVASGPCALALNPDADLVYCVSYDANTVTAIDASQDTVAAVELTGCYPDVICYSDVSNKLYAGYSLDGTGRLAVIDGTTNRLLRSVPIPYYNPTACYNPGSDRVYILNAYDSILTAFDCATDSVVAQIRVPGGSSGLVCSNLDDKVYCTNSEGHTVAIVSTEADSVVATVDLGNDVMLYGMYFDTTGDRLFVQGESAFSSTLFVVDGAADTVLASCGTTAFPYKMCYDPSSHVLYDVDDLNPFCCMIDCHGPLYWQTGYIYLPEQASAVCRNSLNNDMYISSFWAGWIWIIDTKQGQIVDSIYLSDWPIIEDVFYNPLSNRLYCAGTNVYAIDPQSRSVLRVFPASSYNVDGLFAFNRDRNCVYALSIEGSSVLVIADSAFDGLQDCAAKGGVQASRPQSIVRGVLFLPPASGVERSASRVLLDISGRKVLDLQSGANDVRALAPGVYFVRQASNVRRQASSVTKVVLTE
jgi:YVTN family beta-propeller protein